MQRIVTLVLRMNSKPMCMILVGGIERSCFAGLEKIRYDYSLIFVLLRSCGVGILLVHFVTFLLWLTLSTMHCLLVDKQQVVGLFVNYDYSSQKCFWLPP